MKADVKLRCKTIYRLIVACKGTAIPITLSNKNLNFFFVQLIKEMQVFKV
jgi:hypothetical protein